MKVWLKSLHVENVPYYLFSSIKAILLPTHVSSSSQKLWTFYRFPNNIYQFKNSASWGSVLDTMTSEVLFLQSWVSWLHHLKVWDVLRLWCHQSQSRRSLRVFETLAVSRPGSRWGKIRAYSWGEQLGMSRCSCSVRFSLYWEVQCLAQHGRGKLRWLLHRWIAPTFVWEMMQLQWEGRMLTLGRWRQELDLDQVCWASW